MNFAEERKVTLISALHRSLNEESIIRVIFRDEMILCENENSLNLFTGTGAWRSDLDVLIPVSVHIN